MFETYVYIFGLSLAALLLFRRPGTSNIIRITINQPQPQKQNKEKKAEKISTIIALILLILWKLINLLTQQ